VQIGPSGIEYDDGVYLGVAVRFVHGVLPYRDFDFIQPPGIVWLMSPVALLGKLTGTQDAMALARCITVLVEGLNAALIALVVRRRGPTAMIVAGLVFATFPLAATTDHTLTLEPYLVCFCLIGAALLFCKSGLSGPRRVLLAGLAFGFAGSIKLWAVLPLAAALICLLPLWRSAIRPFLAGCVVGFGASTIPFFAFAPHAFIHDVVFVQVNRSTAAVQGGLSVAQRLVMITGLAGIPRFAAATTLAVGIVVGLMALAALTYGLEFRRCTRLDWFALLAAALVIPAMFVPSEFYADYSYFPHTFLALLLGVCLGQLAATTRRLARRDLSLRTRLVTQVVAPVAVSAVVALTVLLVPPDVTYARSLVSTSVDPTSAIDSAIPPGACVTTDNPGMVLVANRFTPGASGCPAIDDPFGMWALRDNGQVPGSVTSIVPNFTADWKAWLERSDYLVEDVQFSDYIPWTPALVAWFNAHFTLISSHTATFVYRNNGAALPNSTAPVPQSSSQLVAAGLAAGRAGDVQRAFDDYTLAAARDANNKFARYDLGTIYQLRGDATDAASQYRAALRIDPKFGDALYNMGVLEAPVDPTSAINYYTQDLKVQPTNASANFNLGVLLIEHGKRAEGYLDLEAGLRLNPALAADIPAGISPPPATSTTS
jgi:hypothetical protein